MHSFPLKASALTFQQAIATESLLSQAEAGELSEPDIAAGIAELVLTDNGARGFFYLTSEMSIADNPQHLSCRHCGQIQMGWQSYWLKIWQCQRHRQCSTVGISLKRWPRVQNECVSVQAV